MLEHRRVTVPWMGGAPDEELAHDLAQYSCTVINLKQRADRWRRISKRLAARLPWLPVHRLEAVDGRLHPPPASDVALRWSTAHIASFCDWYSVRTLKMSPGERGCCASDVRFWRRCVRTRSPTIVLEDDAVVLPRFADVLAQATRDLAEGTETPAHVIWLCAKDRGRAKRVRPGSVLMRPDFLWTTVGYVVTPAGARILLKSLPVDEPVDNFIARLVRDGTLCGYSVRPGVVRQAQTWNVDSDVPHSDDVAHA